MLKKWDDYFNFYSHEVSFEDFFHNPLHVDETLRMDRHGRCFRLHVPSSYSALNEKLVFWLRIQVNQWGHLDAINKLIQQFRRASLESPSFDEQFIELFYKRLTGLISLKNDYGFQGLHLGDPLEIEQQLKNIEVEVCVLFYHYYGKVIREKEREKIHFFDSFTKEFEKKLHSLSLVSRKSLHTIRYFSVFSHKTLKNHFQKELESLRERLEVIESMDIQLKKIREDYRRIFSVPSIKSKLFLMEEHLNKEFLKLQMEVVLLIQSLIQNYKMSPFKGALKEILRILKFRENAVCLDEKGVRFPFESIEEGITLLRYILGIP